MNGSRYGVVLLVCGLLMGRWGAAQAEPMGEKSAPDYTNEVAPILKKYCAGCHNPEEREGKLSLASYDALLAGGKGGGVFTPGEGASSRMVRMLKGEAKPKMPPDDSPAPSAEHIALLSRWIDSGAKGPSGEPVDRTHLVTPKISVKVAAARAIGALAVSPKGSELAVARHATVELIGLPEKKPLRELGGHRGRVNAVAFSASGEFLAVAAGEPGLFGEVRLWQTAAGTLERVIEGHGDAFCDVEFSSDGSLIAAAGYDGRISVWRRSSGERLVTISGHNGAVFDIAFHSSGKILASASADRTVKLWEIPSGERLDTFVEPLKDQQTLAFNAAGDRLAAAGVDNRIRVWRISETGREGTNSLLYSRFAHEGSIFRMAWSRDGGTLVTSAEDRTVKVWRVREDDMAWRSTWKQPDWSPALSLSWDGKQLFAGRLDGSWESLIVSALKSGEESQATAIRGVPAEVDYGPQPEVESLAAVAEVEPNDAPKQATPISVPGAATGRIFPAAGGGIDRADLYRFTAKEGDQWVVETKTVKLNSQLDSKLEILTSDGQPVPALKLQAVRTTEVEFRAVDSNQRGARLSGWEEMLLNEYVYLQGDVMKHFRQRQGPDSDADFYPFRGRRYSFFGTSPRAHAVGEKGYIVVPYAADAPLEDNGLPVFTLNYENDDDGERMQSIDSRVWFVAPRAGDYCVRVSDSRGFSGEDFTYQIVVRRPRPDFSVNFERSGGEVGAGSGREVQFVATRQDQFQGPIRIDVKNLPKGWQVSAPITIEAGHLLASGVVNAAPGAKMISPDEFKNIEVTATAKVFGQEVVKAVAWRSNLKLGSRPKLVPFLELQGTPAPPMSVAQKFTTLVPRTAESKHGATLSVRADSSVLAAGPNADQETYVVAAVCETGGVRSIRLEVLGHESLPAKSPGRAPMNGNFVLTEFKVSAAPVNDPSKKAAVKLVAARADYSQAHWDVAGIIDGQADTGWAIAEDDSAKGYPVRRAGDDASHFAEFDLAEPLPDFPGGVLLTFTLENASVKQHNVGCFRLSVSRDEPQNTLDFPPIPELTIAPGGSVTCRLRVERSGFQGRVPFDVNNLPHGVIVDNIGLSGVLVREGETEREVLLRAEPWVAETTRLFHAVAKVEGDQVSRPILMRVKKDK